MIALTLFAMMITPRCFSQEAVHARKDVDSKAHQTTKRPGVTLEATASIENGRLKIEYEVRNTGKAALYLFNKLYTAIDHNGVWRIDPELAYIILDEGRASVAKRIIPVPPGVSVVAPEIPLVTKLDPGKSFRETISLPLPLKPCDPYAHAGHAKPMTREVEFMLEVGLFTEKPGTAKLERMVSTTVGPSIHFYPFDPAHQTILRTEPFSFRVPFTVEESGNNNSKSP